ncbi:MAG: hypothetical protein ACL93V_04215 [Candidatus Electrothrix sp. YB6]
MFSGDFFSSFTVKAKEENCTAESMYFSWANHAKKNIDTKNIKGIFAQVSIYQLYARKREVIFRYLYKMALH